MPTSLSGEEQGADEPLGRGAEGADEPLGRGAEGADEPLGRGAEGADEPLERCRGSALVVHLGMSGQMLLGELPREDHLRIAALLDDGLALSFVDQRTFGGWMLADMVTVDGTDVPVPVAHLGRDPLDPLFDRDAVIKVLRRKHSEIKRQLLDQTVVSGIGNIYADEALWRAKINGARPASSLTRRQLGELLDTAAEVMAEALGAGRHVVRLAVRQRQRRVRLLRALAGRLRPRRGAMPALRRGDAA